MILTVVRLEEVLSHAHDICHPHVGATVIDTCAHTDVLLMRLLRPRHKGEAERAGLSKLCDLHSTTKVKCDPAAFGQVFKFNRWPASSLIPSEIVSLATLVTTATN
jgi:hypothetical protein